MIVKIKTRCPQCGKSDDMYIKMKVKQRWVFVTCDGDGGCETTYAAKVTMLPQVISHEIKGAGCND